METSSKQLPSIEDLFKDSWATFRKKLVQLLIWSAVGWGVMFGTFMLFILIAGVTLGVGLFAHGAVSNPDQVMSLLTNSSIVPIASLLVLAMVVISMGLGIILLTGYVSIIATNQALSIGTLFKKGWGLIIPGIGINLLMAFFTLGGMILFIIPGIIISMLLSFSLYELIINNRRGMTALSRSVAVVGGNVWSILGRFALLIILQLAIMFFIQVPLGMGEKGFGLGTTLSTLVTVAFNLFTTVYSVLLYKQAEAVTPQGTKGNIMWVGIVAGIGWVLFIASAFFAVQALSKVDWQNIFKDLEKHDNRMYGTNDGMMDTTTQPYMNDPYLQDTPTTQPQKQYTVPTQPVYPTQRIKTPSPKSI